MSWTEGEAEGGKREDAIGAALLKCALGFDIEETTEEYADVDGFLKLLKRKVTKKDVPPDIKAIKIFLESTGSSLGEMSDEALLCERERLIGLLEGDAD